MSGMDEQTRTRYLKAMGITRWTLREDDPQAIPPQEQAMSAETSAVSVPGRMAPLAEHPVSVAMPQETPPDTVVPPDVLPDGLRSPEVRRGEDSWEKLLEDIGSCRRCDLCKTRNRIVPGTGDRHANWLFVGEGPGRQENLQGEPFVGRAGKLLDAMMAAMRIKRGDNVYIANIVKCRASDGADKDRQPTEEEAASCMPYLERQIALIRPTVIVALGKTAAVALLNTDRDVSLASLRNREHVYRLGDLRIPLVVTYHPSYLLRTPGGKKQAWQDLCRAMEIYGREKGMSSRVSPAVS